MELALPLRRYAPIWPYLNWGIFVIGAAYCIVVQLGYLGWDLGSDGIAAGDAVNYWEGGAYSDLHYRYSPAFYWFMRPLTDLPLNTFLALWTAAHLVAIAWLGPWTILLAFDDVIRGNVSTFLAVALVLAVVKRQSWTWTVPIFTKVTPGVGVLYHVARREWEQVAWAGFWVAVVFAWTGLVVPELWGEWVQTLLVAPDNYHTVNWLAPLWVRLPVGALLCYLAGRWVWLLPVGMLIAMPGIIPSSFALLCALPRLRGEPE